MIHGNLVYLSVQLSFERYHSSGFIHVEVVGIDRPGTDVVPDYVTFIDVYRFYSANCGSYASTIRIRIIIK